MKEVRTELAKKMETLVDEQKMMVASMAKRLDEAATKRMELIVKHHEEVEQAKTVLDKVQMTYQTKLMEYEVLATAVADLIKQLKNEKEATEDKTKLSIKTI